MSHWFHRNVLKATTLVSYNNVMFGPFNLTKLASDLKRARERLLDLLPDPAHPMDSLNTAFIAYLSLMCGFFMDYKVSQKKVRYSFTYKWTHTLLGQTPQAQQDAAYDVANMSVNVALWHMKHASFIASKKNVTMDDAKEIHTSLRKAAGIFQMVQKELLPLVEQGAPGSDLDHRVISAYCSQCIAEAQEVTVARAIEMQHNNNLVSALANETSHLFHTAASHLKGLDKGATEQWELYLEIKRNIYLAYAYCYSGKNLLGEEHCGEAIRTLKESQVFYNKALALCKPYSKVKGPAKPVKPDGHSFFTGINSAVSLLLAKCERENGFIYHQKVPESPTDLELKATYGLASPETYNLPPPAPLWEAAFENPGQLPTVKEDSPKFKFLTHKREKDLPPVKEVDHQAGVEETDNGCSIQ